MRLAEVFAAHGAALDVPAGAAGGGAGGAGPLHVAIFRFPGLPEREVGAVLLLVGVGGLGFAGEGGADLEFAFLHAGEGAVAGEGSDLEIHGAVAGGVGVALLHELGDHADLLGDVAGGGGLDVGTQTVQRVAVGVELVGPLLGDLGECAVLLAGAADGLVVDVGDVADVLHLVGAELELEHAAQEVVDDEGAEVADVRRRVDGGAAVVETVDAVGLGRAELFQAAGERVEERDGHGEGGER